MIGKLCGLQNLMEFSIGQAFRGLAFSAVAASRMPMHPACLSPSRVPPGFLRSQVPTA